MLAYMAVPWVSYYYFQHLRKWWLWLFLVPVLSIGVSFCSEIIGLLFWHGDGQHANLDTFVRLMFLDLPSGTSVQYDSDSVLLFGIFSASKAFILSLFAIGLALYRQRKR